MARIINLATFVDTTGSLTVCEKALPFDIKRVFWIYGVDGHKRGGHRHKKTSMAMVCLNGSCRVFVNDGLSRNSYLLDNPDKCLILEPRDWHTMEDFSNNALLLVMASELYDEEDYIFEPYK